MPEKTFPKAVKHVFNMLRGNFFGKNFCPVHPGWSKNLQERSQKLCLSMFCLIFSTEKLSAQCTLETQKTSTEMEMNSNFQKCPKTFPRLSKHVLMWFFRNFLASAPWMVEKSKNFKEMQKLPKIQDTQTRFQKYPNKFWTCFEVFLEKKVPSAPWRVETWKNSKKNRKQFEISKVSKNVPESVQTSFEIVLRWFFRKKMPSATWWVETWKNSKKRKTFNFSKCPKNVPKSNQTCFEHASRYFFWKKIFAQCTLGGRKSQKLQKNGKTAKL